MKTISTLFVGLLASILFVFSCSDDKKDDILSETKTVNSSKNNFSQNGELKLVTNEEYSSLNAFDKTLVDDIEKVIPLLNDNNVADLFFSKKNGSLILKTTIISDENPQERELTANILSGSCTVCGVRSAYRCLKKIQDDDSLGDEFDVHVKRNGGCVDISW